MSSSHPRTSSVDDDSSLTDRLREWAPDILVGVVVLGIGCFELWARLPAFDHPKSQWVPVVVSFAVACGLARRAPAVALALVWVTCAVQALTGVPVLTVELSVTVVAFGCARWGRPATVVLSGLSIPAGAAIGYVVARHASFASFQGLWTFGTLLNGAHRISPTLLVGGIVLVVLMLVVPWLAGLLLRAIARAASAQRESEQAREIAELREGQARLARDVHDVVGHSLAVILAQAESGQYLPDDDPAALKGTMATIASTARSSLQDVRQVLASPTEPVPARTGAFEQLVQGVRASGHEVRVTDVGAVRPLPPELAVAAHRVVQEMLTNAMRHGRRDRPIVVERQWPAGPADRELRITVRNVDGSTSGPASDGTQPIQTAGPPGQGIDGMRRRLDAVGGRLDVRRGFESGEATFTATAWLPVSGR